MFKNLWRKIFGQRRPRPVLEAPVARKPVHQPDPETTRCSSSCLACQLNAREEYEAFIETYGTQLGSLASEHVGEETAAKIVNGNPLDSTARDFAGSPLKAIIRRPDLDEIKRMLDVGLVDDLGDDLGDFE